MTRSTERVVVVSLLAGLLVGSSIRRPQASAQDTSGLVSQVQALMKANDKLQAELAVLQAQLAESRAQQDKLQAVNEVAQKTTEVSRQQVAALQEEFGSAAVQRDKNLKSVVELTDQLHRAFAEVKQLKAENARLRALVPKGATGVSSLEGVVTQVSGPGGVEISIGTNSGLKSGHVLEVFRVAEGKTTSLGHIEVYQTAPDKSICKADPSLLKDPIQEGDRVSYRKPEQPKPQPPAEPPYLFGGEVLSVAEDGQVEISFGAADGLTPGHRLEVYRETGDVGIYVGRVEVVKTQARTAICKLVLEKDTIRKGDRITSRL
ncbi:MAG: hypothetical protein ACYTG0_35165 [Planctomycetota bacterium]|jgi:regulator of replication initiation timing